MRHAAAQALALAAAVLLAIVAVATARETALGRSELEAADRAAAAADWLEAIAHARAAAEAVAPGSPWPERACGRLESIGRDAEARGDQATALLAYGALRSAAIATRVPLFRSGPWRDRADDDLARVAAGAHDPSVPHVTAAEMRDALRASEPP
jgi:hypothetical protein